MQNYETLKSTKSYYLATLYKILNLLTFTICSLVFKFKLAALSVLQQFVLVYAYGAIILYLCYALGIRTKVCSLLSGEKANQSIIFRIRDIITSKERSLLYLGRALCTAIGMLSWIKAITKLGMTEATIISYLSPILTSLLAVFFFKEKIRWNWLLALSLGGVGIYFAIHVGQQYSIELYGGIFAFISAVAWSFYDIICKKQTQKEEPIFQVFLTFALSAIIMLPFALMDWRPIYIIDSMWILILGSLAVISVIMLFMAYRLAPISHLMPHSYLRLIFAIVAMYFILGEVPTVNAIVGAMLIIAANILLFIPYGRKKLST